MQVILDMPDQVARQWGDTPDTIARSMVEDASIEGYRAGRLSQRQVGALLGLDFWQTESFLSQRGVVINYTAEDLKLDSAALDRIVGAS